MLLLYFQVNGLLTRTRIRGTLKNGSIGDAIWANQQLDDQRYFIDAEKPSEVLTLDETTIADVNARED